MFPTPLPRHFLPAALMLLASSAAYAATPADLFADNCASCHGADGKAHTPIGRKLGAKDLAQSTLTEEQIIRQITNGKRSERGAEKMPAFKEKLPAADIAAVAEYVKSLRR